MPRADPSIVWLSADVPREDADLFAAHAQRYHRSSRGQLKVLIDRFLKEEARRAARMRARNPAAAA